MRDPPSARSAVSRSAAPSVYQGFCQSFFVGDRVGAAVGVMRKPLWRIMDSRKSTSGQPAYMGFLAAADTVLAYAGSWSS